MGIQTFLASLYEITFTRSFSLQFTLYWILVQSSTPISDVVVLLSVYSFICVDDLSDFYESWTEFMYSKPEPNMELCKVCKASSRANSPDKGPLVHWIGREDCCSSYRCCSSLSLSLSVQPFPNALLIPLSMFSPPPPPMCSTVL